MHWLDKSPIWVRVLLWIFLFPVFIPIFILSLPKLKLEYKLIAVILWIAILVTFIWILAFSPTTNAITLSVSGISKEEIIKNNKVAALKISTEPDILDEVRVNGELAKREEINNYYSFEKKLQDGENKIKIVGTKGSLVAEKEFYFRLDSSDIGTKDTGQINQKEVSSASASVNSSSISKPVKTDIEIIEEIVKEIEPDTFEITVWHNKEFAEEGQTPYEIILNGSFQRRIECKWAKNLGYALVKSLYTNEKLKNKISNVKITIPYAIRFSLGAEDGYKITENNVWSGETNFWNSAKNLNAEEDNTIPLEKQTWFKGIGTCEL
jgi:hypothetical protein